MTRRELLRLIDEINVWKRGGERAPHKPLLFLYSLGRVSRGEDRLAPYETVDKALRSLLIEFGPPRKAVHPEYPFWRLQNDSLWSVNEPRLLTRRKSNTDPLRSELLKYAIEGGFPEPIHKALKKDASLRDEVAQRLLEAHFPESLRPDILAAVGLDQTTVSNRHRRDPAFRERVIRAYEHRCAVCGFSVRLRHSDVCLEAAHIKWHQAGGPDIEENGIALCSIHHKMLDRGALTVTQDHRVLVSQEAHGDAGFDEWLRAFHSQPLRPPQSNYHRPAPEYLRWHQREVFRKPARD